MNGLLRKVFVQVTVAEEGVRGLAKGWAPTFIGYSMQVSLKGSCSKVILF